MREKIAEEIAFHQSTINELKQLKNIVTNSIEDDIEFIIKSKQKIRYYRYAYNKA